MGFYNPTPTQAPAAAPQGTPIPQSTPGSGGFSDWLSGLDMNALFPDYNAKRGQPGYVRGAPEFLDRNQVPAIWEMFAPMGEQLINQSAQAKLRAASSAVGGGRQELERALLAASQSAGLDPIFAKAQLAESASQPGMQLDAARGDIESQRLQDIYNQRLGLTNTLADTYGSERDLALQLYLGSTANRRAQEAAHSSGLSSLLGAGLGAAGSIFGGPLGGALGSALGGMFNRPPALTGTLPGAF